MLARVLLNLDSPFRKWEGGRLAWVWVGEAESLEAVFAVANKMRSDDNGYDYPWYVRSLSVGDIVVLDGLPYECRDVGWESVRWVDVFDATVHGGIVGGMAAAVAAGHARLPDPVHGS